MSFRPILCIDFDGVIHSYESGWQNGVIYGEATPGFFEWAIKAADLFELHIYSSRSKTSEGLLDMAEAISRWANAFMAAHPDVLALPVFHYSTEKPPAFLTIDDRCIRFDGDWSAMDPAKLREYRPWNVKG